MTDPKREVAEQRGERVLVPIQALHWLLGMSDEGFSWPNEDSLRYGWRSEFARRAGIDINAMVKAKYSGTSAAAPGTGDESTLKIDLELEDGATCDITVHGSERDLTRLIARLRYGDTLRAQLDELQQDNGLKQLAIESGRKLLDSCETALRERNAQLAASEARVREARADLLALHSFNVGFGPAAVWWSDVQKVIAALSGQKQEG